MYKRMVVYTERTTYELVMVARTRLVKGDDHGQGQLRRRGLSERRLKHDGGHDARERHLASRGGLRGTLESSQRR